MPPVSVIEENAVSAEHSIDPDSISSSAVAVTRALQDAGFDAWLVGGCVRDLLDSLHQEAGPGTRSGCHDECYECMAMSYDYEVTI